MKRLVWIWVVFVICPLSGYGQKAGNTWDVALTEILIAHNKDNYSDNQTAEKKQAVSQGTVNTWHKVTNKFKQLTDSINRRLTSAAIVLSDAEVALEIYTALDDIYRYQSESMQIAYQYPFTIPTIIDYEKGLYSRAEDLSLFTTMVVLSYGEVSKMKTSDRKLIYNDVRDKLNALSFQCFSLYVTMQEIETVETIKKMQPANWVNKDKEVANDILQKFNF